MDSRTQSLPSTSIQRASQRSHSLQPEHDHFSSPTSRRRSKNPGRSLTEIFTRSLEPRAKSCGTSVSVRRRTFTTGPSLSEKSLVAKSYERSFMNTSFPDYSTSFNRDDINLYCGNNYDVDIENRLSLLTLPDPEIRAMEPMETDTSVTESNDTTCRMVHESKLDEEEKLNYYSWYWNILRLVLNCIFLLTSILLITILFYVGSETYFAYRKAQCDLKREMKMPLDDLERNLSSLVFGQEIAVNAVLNSLRDFEESNSNSPLLVWMVGWTGSGKTHTASIWKNVFSSMSNSLTIIPSLLPRNESSLQKEIVSIFKKLDSCSYNLIFIEGWDEDNAALQTLKQFVSYMQDTELRYTAKGNIILVLIGTQGSHIINQEYFKQILSGKQRQDIVSDNFRNVILPFVEAHRLTDITGNLIFVPFLPMESEQVRLCIIEELQILEKSGLVGKIYNQEKLIHQFMTQIEFLPHNHPLLSVTGCKRVLPLLRLIISENRYPD
ncbi:hypothetical protein SK128_018506 [Halocaridina rubra]|uniref:Torsin n=1 Tax=Halocaridina rubra TaxID=373956 RepID=A0AAN8XRR6_HALRR